MIEKFRYVDTDKRVRRDILPIRIVCERGIVENSEILLNKSPLQTTIGTNIPEVIMKNTIESENASIVIDFGYEFHGSLRIITGEVNSGLPKAEVRIALGESVTEAVTPVYTKGSGNDHSPRDFVREIPAYSDLEYGISGFRFARIELLSSDAILRIQSVTGVFIYTDLEYKGTFRCNDETVNRIYDVAAYTVHLNIQRFIWDGIKRDRLVWMGDMNPETLAIRTVFGNCAEVEKTLDYFRLNTTVGDWMNGMPTYTLWWIITVYEWYFYSGDDNFLLRQKDYILKTVQKILSYIDDDGAVNRFPGNFLDWPTSNLPQASQGVRGLLCMAVDASAELAGLCGFTELSKACRQSVKAIRAVPGDSDKIKTIAAFLYNAGIEDRWDTGDILTRDGAKGLSTFMSFYVLKAMSNSGRHKEALDILKDYYGAMLRLGATTFWEDFNIEWAENAVGIDELPDDRRKNIHSDFGGYCYKGMRHSLCHGWSAGPVPFLNDFVLGIKITGIGCKSIDIKGNLGNLDWAEGTFPTPYGTIYVKHEKLHSGEVKTFVRSPDEIKVRILKNNENY